MSRAHNQIDVDSRTARELWVEVLDTAPDEMPLDDPTEGQVLARLCAEYLDYSLRVSGRGRKIYHSDLGCPYISDKPGVVTERTSRKCKHCAGRFAGNSPSIRGMD